MAMLTTDALIPSSLFWIFRLDRLWHNMNALNYCPQTGCDLTLRVLQGGKLGYYAIAQSFSSALTDEASAFPELATKAVNLAASAGEVTLVELLDTPDANVQGVPDQPRILGRWARE